MSVYYVFTMFNLPSVKNQVGRYLFRAKNKVMSNN